MLEPDPRSTTDRSDSNATGDRSGERDTSAVPSWDDGSPDSLTVRSARNPIGPGRRPDSSIAPAGESPRVPGESAELPSLPRPGDMIDFFELAEPIGVGGMGAVFRARDTRLDRQVALKILPPEQAVDPEVVQRFYQEGRAAARLDHENIARVYTIGHDAQLHYIAFEYIEGITLRQRVERSGPLPVGEAINYALQIADALVHASSREVVHRDIKPSNIIVTPLGRAKLVDMGLARRFERGGDDGLTQSGMTLGTFDYISPEQARDPRDVDVRSDLYSLGCTLFHMLTGRPPFPGGTVIQKLIQHQEEPPPDIRELNPSVPDDLAAAIVRLMAKDRDRRYQSPELLVRDLLTTAGALGLRSSSPEGLVWSSPAPAPGSWERNVVWGLPFLLFLLVVVGLVYFGQEPAAGVFPGGDPLSRVGPQPERPAGKAAGDVPRADDGRGGAAAVARKPPSPTAAEARSPRGDDPPAATVREVMVDSGESLLEAIAQARPRETLILTDDGPYLIDPGPAERPHGRTPPDLTIKADSGARPVIRLGRGGAASQTDPPAILAFEGGRVTLDGLEFDATSEAFGDAPSALLARSTELTVRNCVFRRASAIGDFDDFPDPPDHAAILLDDGRGALPTGDRPPSVTIERSHFDGDQVGVLARGRADVTLRDCTFAACEPAIRLENANATPRVPADLRLSHVSIVAGDGPMLRLQGTEARIWADDSVFAAATSTGTATLIEADLADAITWRGRGNLYARVGTFFRVPGAGFEGPATALSRPEDWSGPADSFRETGSAFVQATAWAEDNPLRLLANESRNPTRAFRLAESRTGLEEVGVRRGPFGDPGIPPRNVALARAEAPSTTATEPAEAARPGNGGSPSPEPAPRATPAAAPTTDEDLPEMPVMPPPTTPARGTPVPEEPAPAAAPASRTIPAAGAGDIRSAADLVEAVRRLDGREGVLTLPADADWKLEGLELRPRGTLRIEAAAGQSRPRLQLWPPVADGVDPRHWWTLLDLRSGALQIRGVDLILPARLAPVQGRWAAFSAAPGTQLRLTDCTVTLEGDQAESSVVVLGADAPGTEPAADGADANAATIRVVDSLLRAGGDMLDVSAGRRVVLEAENTVVATGGSLAHIHGLPRGQAAEKISLTLRQVSARVAGGLVLLEAAPDEPELPQVEIKASDSVFATDAKDAPLLRVDSQDGLDSARDKIAWEGQGNGYHQISTYRRDQSAQLGTIPSLYNRPSWTVALGDREADPIHGDLKFLRDWNRQRPPWTLVPDDVRLSASSPARLAGSILDRIPTPPPSVP